MDLFFDDDDLIVTTTIIVIIIARCLKAVHSLSQIQFSRKCGLVHPLWVPRTFRFLRVIQ